jgi:carboxyl-terminal processing protease
VHDSTTDRGHLDELQNRKKGVSTSTLIGAIFATLLIGFVLGTRSDAFLASVGGFFGLKTTTDTVDLSDVQRTYRELKANYDGQLDKNALIDGASRGLVAAAGDRYTVFMDKKEAEEFQKELSGEVSGIGAEIGVRNSQPTILRLLSGSPAEKSGLQAGDTIVGVNDLSMRDADAETAAKNIRGDEGTSVKIVVRRGADIKDFTITRAKVSDVSVRSRIENGIGIMTITRFDIDTGDLTRRAAEQFKTANVRGVVLDIRDNGGGYLDAGRDVAGLWVKDKVIVSEKTGGKTTDEVKSTADPILAGIKTVVLVNGSSASASEIVAGALQDYSVAKLVGEKTFGKGTVQKMIELSDGRLLKVTIARWYTPKGKNITKEGITPDRKVEMTSTNVNEGKDPQLDAALGMFE